MGSLSPALLPLVGTAAGTAVGTTASTAFPAAASVVSAGMKSLTAVQQAKSGMQAAQASADRRVADLHRKRAIDERIRRNREKKDLAALRARFGASGLLASPSADAVLDGIRQETERRIADARMYDQLSINRINRDLDNTTRRIRNSAHNALQNNLLRI